MKRMQYCQQKILDKLPQKNFLPKKPVSFAEKKVSWKKCNVCKQTLPILLQTKLVIFATKNFFERNSFFATTKLFETTNNTFLKDCCVKNLESNVCLMKLVLTFSCFGVLFTTCRVPRHVFFSCAWPCFFSHHAPDHVFFSCAWPYVFLCALLCVFLMCPTMCFANFIGP